MRTAFFCSALVALPLVACGDDDGSTGTSTSSSSSSGSTSSSSSASTTTSTTSSTSSGTGGSGGGMMMIDVPFAAKVGAETFDCAQSYTGLGTTDATANITDFRFYVYDVMLHDQNHNEVPLELDQDGLWQYENVALLDFENKTGACANGTTETRTFVRGHAPEGTYVGVSFKLGVPDELNHLDSAQAPSPLNLTAMFWAWTSGYKYLRVDSVAMGGAGPFNLHLGATGCVGDPAMGEMVTCSNQNVAQIEFHSFDFANEVIVADYAAAIADSDLLTDGGGAPGCMSGGTDPECEPIFPNLGLDLETGDPSPSTLSFFRIE